MTVANIPTANGVASGLSVLLAALALRGSWQLRATTLAAPCRWAALAGICLALGAVFESRFDGIGLSAFRFAIAAITLCPLMAVLGAKRPQDRGWQWVVLTLWVVLIWPAVQAVLLPVGVRVELFIAWKLFLWGLIGVSLLNYLPTRYWLAALGVATGQIILLQAYLGLSPWLPSEWSLAIGTGCFLLSALWVDGLNRRRWLAASETILTPFDKRWRRFRDAYGAFWALRIFARINQTAELREWPLRLSWSGFVLGDRQPTSADLAELEQTLATLSQRFMEDESC